jgi:hypothetical protein
MDHEGARRLMAEAMERRLDADDERELALHLVGCDECKATYEGLQQAHPALESIKLGEPSTESVDAAVHRALTVLRGEADPGPMGLTEEAPKMPDVPEAPVVRIDTSTQDADLLAAPPVIVTGPMSAPEGTVFPGGPHVRPIETTPPAVDDEPIEDVPDLPIDVPIVIDEPVEHTAEGAVEHTEQLAPVSEWSREADEVEAPLLAPELPTEQVPAPVEVAAPQSDIDRLLDEDRMRYEPLPYPDDDDDRDRIGPGPWLIAIAITVALSVLTVILITRGEGLLGGSGSDLPSSQQVRDNVERAFADMKSLKATFDVQRLSLYRISREENTLRYSFSNGRYRGSIDYDRSEGYKQDHRLTVGDEETQRVDLVQSSDETRALIGSGADASVNIERNPPLGPPDGQFRPTMGLLEDALGSAARALARAEDLKVVESMEEDGRQMFKVVATVQPNELTRADRIVAALDANNFLPIIVERSITRANARVLGPSSALDEEALDTAFGTNERLTTELVRLTNVQYDEIVLPGDLLLDLPAGTEEGKPVDYRFERLTRAELSTKLDFDPLLPRTLPNGYEEQQMAVYNGDPKGWGPGGTLPKPLSVFHSSYFDGKTTIVVTQRRFEKQFKLERSPLTRAGLEISVKSVERDGRTFSFGVSPEVPPHVYGFIGNTFVMATGYAPQAELISVLTSLAETPVEVPSTVDVSPSPGTSPDASPAASPATTASPTP